jgi:hypothetical protein
MSVAPSLLQTLNTSAPAAKKAPSRNVARIIGQTDNRPKAMT